MLRDMTCETFVPHLNQAFRLEADGARLELELVEAEPTGPAAGGEERRAFSLVFRGPAEPFLEQRIHPLEHDELGRLELFLVPIGQVEDGFLYQAVFT